MTDLHPFDDFPYHQAIAPMGIPHITDTRFNDGYYFAAYAAGVHVFCGLRFHPNTNVVDGYAGMVEGGVQYGWRASRALDADRRTMAVGPLSIEIVDPMESQRVVCAPTVVGDGRLVGFDLLFTASAPAFVETPDVQYRYGRVLNHVLRYTQPVRATGTLTSASGVRAVDSWHGARDHSWGIRNTMGPHLPVRGAGRAAPDPRAMRLWVPFEAGDVVGFFHLHRDAAGALLDCEGRLHRRLADGVEREGTAIVDVEHELRYLPGSRRFASGRLALHLEDGAVEVLDVESVCAPAHPQGFGYSRGWGDGGNPGVWRGVSHLEADVFDVSDPAAVAGPPHTDPRGRLGGTEFACLARHHSGDGMAHVEHMLYG